MRRTLCVILLLLFIIVSFFLFIGCSPLRGRIVLKNYTDKDMILFMGMEGEDYLTDVTQSSFNFNEEKAINALYIPPGTTGTYIYAETFMTDWDVKIGDTHYIDNEDPLLHDNFNFKLDVSYIFKISGYGGKYAFSYDIDEYD